MNRFLKGAMILTLAGIIVRHWCFTNGLILDMEEKSKTR